jgi:ABC-type multidrug transport system fused ATPase/permease subunit
VVVLEGGRVAAAGRPRELLERSSLFRELVHGPPRALTEAAP